MREQKEDAKRIGALIRQLREERQWTQTDLAERANLSQNAVSTIERGRYLPSQKTAIQLAQALQVSLTMLVPSGVQLQTPKPPETPFALMIREARRRLGWTQQQLVEMVGITANSIHAFETGQRQPMRRSVVERLAQVLEVPIDELQEVWHPSHSPESRIDGEFLECIRCHEKKPLDAFHKHQSRCKACREEVRQATLARSSGWTHTIADGVLIGHRVRIIEPPRKAYIPHPEDHPDPVWCQFEKLPVQWFPQGRLRPLTKAP